MSPAMGARTVERSEAIQVMRGLAALLVVLVHAINLAELRAASGGEAIGWLAQPRLGLNEFGASGVDLFFVISGFVMGGMLLRRPDLSIGAFARDRFIRIVPFFWLLSVAYGVLLLLSGGAVTSDAAATTLTILPLHDPGHFEGPVLAVGWSLAFELAFYSVVGMTLLARPAARTGLAVLAVLSLAAAGAWFRPSMDLVSIWSNAIWLDFLIGLLLHCAWHRWRDRCSKGLALTMIVTGIVFLLPSTVHEAPFLTSHSMVVDHFGGITRWIWWCLPWTLVLAGLMWRWDAGAAEGGAIREAAVRLGDASYSLYLSHMFALAAIQHAWPAGLLSSDQLVLFGMLASIVLGFACYVWIDRPLLRTLRRRTPGKGAAGLPILEADRPLSLR